MSNTSLAAPSSAFPVPPSSTAGTEARFAAKPSGRNVPPAWSPVAGRQGRKRHGRSVSLGGMELQQQQGQSWTHSGSKRFSAFLPDDEEASSFLPSPPTTPPFSYADRHTLAYTPPSATTSEQLFAFPLGHPSSSSTFARRRAHPISPPLSPQSTADCRPLPSTDSLLFSSPARPRPPPLASAGPSASPASKRISLIKRKPVPQFEEDVELVEDPRWDPTRAAAAASASEEAPLSPGIEAGLRRMSVEDPPSAIARTTQRSVKTLPRLAKGSLPITFMAPLPSPSATDSDERSFRSSSSCAGPPSTTPTSPSLHDHTLSLPISVPASPSAHQSSLAPPSKRVFRPFALLRRKGSKPSLDLGRISLPLERAGPETDELDAWMSIMGGRHAAEDDVASDEEEQAAPAARTRPLRTLAASDRASRASSRLSVLSVQSYGGSSTLLKEDVGSYSPLVTTVPRLVYGSSMSSNSASASVVSSREGSLRLSLPVQEETRGASGMRTSMSMASDETGVEGDVEEADEVSLPGSGESLEGEDLFHDASSSRRPSTNGSISSAFTDGSLVEVLGAESLPTTSGAPLESMMEVEEPPTPNPNHLTPSASASIQATPRPTNPPSPVAQQPPLFSAFTWTPDASTPPITFTPAATFLDRSMSPSPAPSTSSSLPSGAEGKRRTSLTARPPKPPKSPRRGSKASSTTSLSTEDGLDKPAGAAPGQGREAAVGL